MSKQSKKGAGEGGMGLIRSRFQDPGSTSQHPPPGSRIHLDSDTALSDDQTGFVSDDGFYRRPFRVLL